MIYDQVNKYQVVKVSPGGSLPLTPLTPSRSSHSFSLLSLPLTRLAPLSLPMANVGWGYVILCFGVPTTSVGARGERRQGEQEGVRGARGEQEEVRGVRGSKRERRE